MQTRCVISDVSPAVDLGQYPVKRVVGDVIEVQADIFRDGHEGIAAELHFGPMSLDPADWQRVPMQFIDNDRWRSEFTPTENALYGFQLQAWSVHAQESRADKAVSQIYPVMVDRPRALYGNWYELFVRESFAAAKAQLPRIEKLGFNVIYLPPIHPVGFKHRKGPNNSLTCGPDDIGCPWAIGNVHGGHTAVDPRIGTLDDFSDFVRAAHGHGIEIALDYALQCSPDHPWIKQHPGWFYWRPDGSIQCAENPPKKYEDVVPLNFDCTDLQERTQLWNALLDIVLFWYRHGVHIFRVDNPHTKPFAFWQWLIITVQKKHPEVVFLAEAFTKPKVMHHLAKLGFSQSYTYFTWRNEKRELQAYLEELTTLPIREFFRPNIFTNTPDILPQLLQQHGRPAFMLRAVLAATLVPTWGIYSGYELCENDGLPGREEYKDSEKYQIKVRDWQIPGNINDLITKLNKFRDENPALHRLDNLCFFNTDNASLLAYGKEFQGNRVIVVVNLDPTGFQEGFVEVPTWFAGSGGSYGLVDMLDGKDYTWGPRNYVRLTPPEQVAHVFRVT